MISPNPDRFWLENNSVLIPNNIAFLTSTSKLTYMDFYNECKRIRNHLSVIGIHQNDLVGILYSHSFKFFMLVNALWMVGAVPVLFNTREKNEIIINQLKKVSAKFLLIDEKLRAKYSQLTFNSIFFIKNVLENKLENDNTIENFNFDNDAVILFTSGSSGEPKAVVHTFKSLYESVKAIDLFANLSQKDIWLASLPHYHIGGFMIFIRSLLAGSALAFPNSLNYEDFINAYIKHEPTYISLVVTTLKKMLNDNISVNKKLKYIFLGGGPIATDLCVDAINKGFPIIKVYGSTETCSMITALHPLEFKLKPNSSGLPLDKSKIKIKIKDEYKKRIGEVLVKSPTLFKEYLNDEILTKEKYYDSFYNTGDYGWIDNDGYLFIEARREDIIITGGENVSIKEIENAFSNINGIKEFHIFSLKDEKWGQSINAVVVKGIPDITDDEIKSVLKTKLASFKIPKRIFFLEVIPKTELGKVNKNELLKLLKLNSSLVF